MTLPKPLQDAWNEAAAHPGEAVDIGALVVCDSCNSDFTHSAESGGFIFGSYGYCPHCAPRMLADIERYGETEYIRARCPEGMSFADFIRAYHGPRGNKIRITQGVA